jgi:ribonuclease BN (tRNA processing enzyme)
MIRFHILGAGGAVPTPSHCPAAYWIDLDGLGILMDPGPGATVRLVKSGRADDGVDAIDTVLLSHLHPDHSADLVPLLFAAHSPVCRNPHPLKVHGPAGLKELLEKLDGIYGSWLEPRSRALEVTEWDLEAPALDLPGGGRVTAFPTEHPQDRLSRQTLGFVLEDGAGNKIVYSGDTGPCAALKGAARGADLLVVECSTPDELAIDGHMFPSAVAELCREARPNRVVLTHQYPAAARIDLAAAVLARYDGEVHQARDGDEFTLGWPT